MLLDRCPVCDEVIDPEIRPTVYALIKGRSIKKFSAKQANEVSAKNQGLVFHGVHENHFEALKVKVKAGDYPSK